VYRRSALVVTAMHVLWRMVKLTKEAVACAGVPCGLQPVFTLPGERPTSRALSLFRGLDERIAAELIATTYRTYEEKVCFQCVGC
jgi:hypothetical protein